MPKIFLAACSHIKNPIINSGIKPHYILESFMDLRGNGKSTQEYINWCLTADEFLLDSGAYSFMNKAKKATNLTTKEINTFIKDYAQFIIKYNIQHYFEMDLDCIFPYSKIKKIRKYLEETTKRKCIPVWHMSRGMNDFYEMCLNYDYVAVGGINNEIKKKDQGIFYKLCDIAHSFGCKVHGLGYLPLQIINENNCPFDTIDGTGWQGHIRAVKFSLENNNICKEKDLELSNGKRSWKDNEAEGFRIWTEFSKLKELN